MNNPRRSLACAACVCAMASVGWAQAVPAFTPTSASRPHVGPVAALAAVPGSAHFFTAGSDGFLAQRGLDGSYQSWQVSDLPIRMVAAHPDGKLVALYESDGFSVHRVSLWDWDTRTRRWAKRLRDPVTALAWSARGRMLMIGNTSLAGIVILDASGDEAGPALAESPGVVTLAVTGASESSMITFGPSGRITYTDLGSRAARARYDGERDLSNPVLVRNNRWIAGWRDGAVLVVDATSGKRVARHESGAAVFASAITDPEPVWIEALPAPSSWRVRRGDWGSAPFSLETGETVTSALSLPSALVLGTSGGTVYALKLDAIDGDAPTPVILTGPRAPVVDDIASDGTTLYTLGSGTVRIAEAPGEDPRPALEGVPGNRISIVHIPDGDAVILWSDRSTAPITMYPLDGSMPRVIHQPRETVTSLVVRDAQVALIEGRARAVSIDLAITARPFVYEGAGLQDAVPAGDHHLVVSKSSTPRSRSPLILIDARTGETVPLQIDGALCFSLKPVAGSHTAIDGIAVVARDDGSSATEAFTLDFDPSAPLAAKVRVLAAYADEDLHATVSGDSGYLLTTLGKGSLIQIDRGRGDQRPFERGRALPSRATMLDRFVVTLNSDGSVTWYERATRKPFPGRD